MSNDSYEKLTAILKMATAEEGEDSGLTKVGFPLPEMSDFHIFFPTAELDNFMGKSFGEIEDFLSSEEIGCPQNFVFDESEETRIIAALAVRSGKFKAGCAESQSFRYLKLEPVK